MAHWNNFWFYRRSIRGQFLRSEYGLIFALGCLSLIGAVGILGMLAYVDHPQWQSVFTMAVAHMIAGKGVSVVQGLAVGLHPLVILILATVADMVLMLLAYPVFVFTYEHFFETALFQRHMRGMFESAQRRMDRIGRFKVFGVFMFVWLPFWMTGVLAGSILGYTLGLRSWVTLSTAALGTFTSIVVWLFFSNQVVSAAGWMNDQVVGIGVLILLAGLLVWRRRKRRRLQSCRSRSHAQSDVPE